MQIFNVTCDQKLAGSASLVYHTYLTKRKYNGKAKRKHRAGWAVLSPWIWRQYDGWGLWWERFLEMVSLSSFEWKKVVVMDGNGGDDGRDVLDWLEWEEWEEVHLRSAVKMNATQ